MGYLPRVVDTQLAEYLGGTRAISIEGPRAVGKTLSASRFAASVMRLDDPAVRSIASADRMAYLRALDAPVLIDEWQLDPPLWDAVRRLVDDEPSPGRFLLTGSANPGETVIHAGSGRFLRLRMRPLSFSERRIEGPTVSIAALWRGDREVRGRTGVAVRDYAEEIIGSGFPGLREEPVGVRRRAISDYLQYAIEHEVPALGGLQRRPAALRTWLRPYAAASSSTASLRSIAAAASPEEMPSKATITEYRNVLARLWLLDDVPAWLPSGTGMTQVMQAPKHQLADPALAASILGVDADGLVLAAGDGDNVPRLKALRDAAMLGALFESLVTLSLRVDTAPLNLDVGHFRTHRGDHEVDLILQGRDGRVMAIEVKLAAMADDHDVRHLRWLAERLGDRLIDSVVVTTGPAAYRRPDGIAVVPLALLGP